ncbi:hypothetical protein GCM10017774_37810 [Lentzea cavernae]|uniref:Uncharacterized protein n=1 Tax=Lentzea cavernae TaxID=2020703 RepID=A0ABQ3MG66_9PSEU|nr:hypothetical protein GCM10017774_37810 [Lentzea cavernae]
MLCQAFQCVKPGQADRRLVRAELFGGFGGELGDSAVGGVFLRGRGDTIGVQSGVFGD